MSYRIYPLSDLRPYGVTYRSNQERGSQQPPRFDPVARDRGTSLHGSARTSPHTSPKASPQKTSPQKASPPKASSPKSSPPKSSSPKTCTTSTSQKRKTPPTSTQSSPTGPDKKTKYSNDSSQNSLPKPTKISFQLLSDIHLERPSTAAKSYETYQIPAGADYLLLAGDIGSVTEHTKRYIGFLARICNQKRFKRVYLIMGNNDPRGTAPDQLNLAYNTAKSWNSLPEMNGKLRVMEKDREVISDGAGGNVVLLATTLWSSIKTSEEIDYCRGMPDFGKITGNTYVEHTQRFDENIKWLRKAIKDARAEFGGQPSNNTRILVMTHHAPTKKDISRKGNKSQPEKLPYFGTSILGVDDGAAGVEGLGDGDVWVYGHTHFSTSFVMDGVQVYSNQKGNTNVDPVFNNKFRFEM